MEAKANLQNLKMAPRKVRAIADLVRGKHAGDAINMLALTPKAAASPLRKLLQSAVANAADLSKGKVDVDQLIVKTITVDQAETARRYLPRAMGRATPLHKKTSHVSVVLSDNAKS
jgi:large subunit ribosomal protein L22